MTNATRLSAVMSVVGSPLHTDQIGFHSRAVRADDADCHDYRDSPHISPRWRYIRSGKRILPPRHAAVQAHDTRKPGRSHCLIYWRGLVRLFQDQEEAECPDAPLSHHW